MKTLFQFALIASVSCGFQKNFAADFDATTEIVGRGTNGLITPVNQLVTPVGIQVALPRVRPNALALSPNGKILVTSGLTRELIAIEPVTGRILQTVEFPTDKAQEQEAVSSEVLDANKNPKISFAGLAFSPDGKRIFLSNVNGDIKVFAVGKTNDVSPLTSFDLPAARAPRRTNEIPTGIAVSRDGKKIYVVGNLSNRLFEMDSSTGTILHTWDVGVAPFDVVLAGKKIYVSNWGGRRPETNSITGPAGRGTLVRVDERSIASEGSVTVIDLAKTNQSEIIAGLHSSTMALSPNGKLLVVANAGSDTLTVIDTGTDKIVETIWARQNPGDLFGAQPNALAFDKSGKKLFVCNGTQNAVAVFHFKPGESKLLGLIPVGWFPGAIAYDSRGKRICVANLKDIGTTMQKASAKLGM
ncbi:MAG TPA: YncE family protein, partial [Candidatus Baltobacteraceae bacterium]|nr:YncE family protein [Candidatus Baltobacteraceae bacterium]